MNDPTENQPPLDRPGIALRYVCAGLPMLFHAVILVVVVAQNSQRLPMALVDVGLGLVGLVLMRWRRARPWPIALVTALLTLGSTTATGPAQVAYVSLCTHRKWRQIVPIAAVSWLCLAASSSRNGVNQATTVSIVTGTVILGGLTIFGLYLRSRRDLAAARREQAAAAEQAQLQRIEQVKLAERAQIAREMHDVLAHRISLLSMLAGGLAYRTDLTAQETRQTALAIQENAHQSLNELRSVLGTLRTDGEAEATHQPLADLDGLFDEVRAAGQQVEVHDSLGDRSHMPAQTGRHVYRIVREALTNARKHAPGSTVRIELGGRPGDGLRVQVSNPHVAGAPAGTGGKLGLVGLNERVKLAGGSIGHTVRQGRFILEAELPWET